MKIPSSRQYSRFSFKSYIDQEHMLRFNEKTKSCSLLLIDAETTFETCLHTSVVMILNVTMLQNSNLWSLIISPRCISKEMLLILYFVNRHIVRSLNYAKKGGWGATPTPTSISILDSYDMKTLWFKFGYDIFTGFKMPRL